MSFFPSRPSSNASGKSVVGELKSAASTTNINSAVAIAR